jgi:hypothetical protein
MSHHHDNTFAALCLLLLQLVILLLFIDSTSVPFICCWTFCYAQALTSSLVILFFSFALCLHAVKLLLISLYISLIALAQLLLPLSRIHSQWTQCKTLYYSMLLNTADLSDFTWLWLIYLKCWHITLIAFQLCIGCLWSILPTNITS